MAQALTAFAIFIMVAGGVIVFLNRRTRDKMRETALDLQIEKKPRSLSKRQQRIVASLEPAKELPSIEQLVAEEAADLGRDRPAPAQCRGRVVLGRQKGNSQLPRLERSWSPISDGISGIPSRTTLPLLTVRLGTVVPVSAGETVLASRARMNSEAIERMGESSFRWQSIELLQSPPTEGRVVPSRAGMEHDNEQRVRNLLAEAGLSAQRDYRTWSIGALVLLVVVAAIAAVVLPRMGDVTLDGRFVPGLIYGAISVVLLFNIYLLWQGRALWGARADLVRQLLRFEAAERLALTDPLTGVFNRRYLDRVLSNEMKRAERSGNPLSLMILDLDHFGEVNKSLGHSREIACFASSPSSCSRFSVRPTRSFASAATSSSSCCRRPTRTRPRSRVSASSTGWRSRSASSGPRAVARIRLRRCGTRPERWSTRRTST